MLKDLLIQNRTRRRFYQNERISPEILRELVDLTRYTPSTANSQALKFRIVYTPEECSALFPHLIWAGALKDWDGPEEGERPAAYIVILCDKNLNKMYDDGIAALTMMLGATERGLGGCIFGSVQREEAAKALNIDTELYKIDLVLALGKPKEIVKIVDVPQSGCIDYYRDREGIHYVPKRELKDILLPGNPKKA